MCCKAFARQFPLLSTGHCLYLSSLLVQVPLLPPPGRSLFCAYFFPPPLLNMALTGGEAGPFSSMFVRCSFFPPPTIIPGSVHRRVALHEFSPALVIPSFPFSPRRGVRSWGLRSVLKYLQSTELHTSLQHVFQLDCCSSKYFFFYCFFLRDLFLLLSFFFQRG